VERALQRTLLAELSRSSILSQLPFLNGKLLATAGLVQFLHAFKGGGTSSRYFAMS
jgi:hypothetical protein